MNGYELKFVSGYVLELGGNGNPVRNANGKRITTNMDIIDSPQVDIKHDLSKFPWPIKDETFHNCFAKYVIEHIEWKKVPAFIKEIYRILKKDGKAIVICPNTYEQCKLIVERGIDQGTTEMLFGSQEYENYGGVHKSAYSITYAKKLFRDAGFSFVNVFRHPSCSTDLVVEAYKMNSNEIFERQYFEDGTIGYKEYRDFATHFSTARKILQTGAKSILDIGGGRGYVCKLLENEGITAVCMDISNHCFQTRATDNFILWDATKTPWSYANPEITYPFRIEDKKYNLCFSINFLEHIPEEHIDDVIKESIRVSKAGFHGIHFDNDPFQSEDKDIDITHVNLKSQNYWENKFKSIDPNYQVVIKHPRYIEYEQPERQPPITLMPETTDTALKLNLGSFQDMFYYGWKNIDILDLRNFANSQKYDFIQHDLTKGIPFEDDSVSLIISNHLIEHIERDEGKKLLMECYRVMKKGAVLRISTPDTRLITKKYLDGEIWDYRYINVGVENANDDAEAYYNLLLAGHKTIYDEDSLKKMIQSAGFKNVKRVSPFESRSEKLRKETISTHPSVSLCIEAEK